MTNLKDQKGLTLVEILITVVIAGIIFSLALSLQFFGLRSYSSGTSQAEIQQNARIIDEVIRKELRNATNIGNGDYTLNFSSNTLSFANASFDLEGINSISLSATGETENDRYKIIRYIISGNGYELANEIYLNNTSIEEGADLSFPLSYNKP